MKGDSGYLAMIWCWLASAGLILGVLIGVGKLLLKETGTAVILLGFAALMALVIYRILSKEGWEKVIE